MIAGSAGLVLFVAELSLDGLRSAAGGEIELSRFGHAGGRGVGLANLGDVMEVLQSPACLVAPETHLRFATLFGGYDFREQRIALIRQFNTASPIGRRSPVAMLRI